MPGIPKNLLKRLRDALGNCDQLGNHGWLCALFVDRRIYHWKKIIPEARNLDERVDKFINTFHKLYNENGQNALILIINVLADRIDCKDNRYYDLVEIAKDLEKELLVLRSEQGISTKLQQRIQITINTRSIVLDLSECNLKELPEEITQFTWVRALDLTGNQLTTLSPEISKLAKLWTLVLSNNQLTTLPSEISQLTKLDKLDLEDNQMIEFPLNVAKLPKLLSLNLSKNQLTQLPGQIGELKLLQRLFLGHNNLEQLPPDICRLTDLKSLNLQYNQLTSLPLEIQCLEALEELHLYGNNLLIPNEFLKCNKYKPQRIIERYLKEHEKNNNNI